MAEALGPADVDRLVLNTFVQDVLEARREGVYCAVRWEEKPGSAGIRARGWSRPLLRMACPVDAAGGASVVNEPEGVVRDRGDATLSS